MFDLRNFKLNKKAILGLMIGVGIGSTAIIGVSNKPLIQAIGATKVGGNSPGGLNPYLGEFADYKEPEILSSGDNGGALIVSLDNGYLGGNFVDLNSIGNQTNKDNSYGGRLAASNGSSLAFVPRSLANDSIFTKYPYHYWAHYQNSTYSTESLDESNRLIRESGSRTIADPYWEYYWGGSSGATSVKSGLSTSDLLLKDKNGRYKFEDIVDMGNATSATQKNRQIWCNIADLSLGGESPSDYLNSNWFKLDTRASLDNTVDMKMKDKQIQSIHYLDMLMSLYSASKGTSTESEWRQAIINYLNSNGGQLKSDDDNLTNIMLSRGVIWGTKATAGVSDDDFLTVSNGADLVSFLYRIDRYNDIREEEVAEDYYKSVGSDVNKLLQRAYNGSRADAIADGVWYEETYWKPLLGFVTSTTPKSGSTSGDFRTLEAVSINTSKGAHSGINIIDGLPLSATVKNQEVKAKAYWTGLKDGYKDSYNRDYFTFGNTWEETDGNKMYNSSSEIESSTMTSYTNSLGITDSNFRETANTRINIVIDGRLGSIVDVNNIIDNNKYFKVKFDITRKADAYNSSGSKISKSINSPSYTVSANSYSSGKVLELSELGWSNGKEDLRAFLNGTMPFDKIVDNSPNNQDLKTDTKITYSYNVKTTIYYGTNANDLSTLVLNSDTNDVTVKRKDYANKKGAIQHVDFHSKPIAYSELKEGTIQVNGTGSNETWEAMAGVPSTETLYYSAGGSEFITELHMSYIPKERAKRYYHTEFAGTDCEYKFGDQAGTYSDSGYTGGNGIGWIANTGNSGGGGANVIPKIGRNFGGGDASVQSESYTFNVHTGGTISVTIGGTIHNDAPDTVEVDGMGDAEAENPHVSRPADMASRDAAYDALKTWTNEVGATSIYYTASSDNVTRQIKLNSNGCSISLPAKPNNEPADTSDYDGYNSHTEGDPGVEVPDPAHASAPKGADVTWSVTATVRIPAHVLCGPCCEHTLPAIQDNWTQISEYSYMRIDSTKTWKIDRAYISGMNEITYTKQSTVMADLIQGEPTLYYHIADENSAYYNESKTQLDYYASHGDLQKKNFVLHAARAGRIIYSLEPTQFDDVGWNEGTRSNRCNGDQGCYTRCGTNPFRVNAGTGRKNIKNTQPEAKGSSSNSNCNKNDQKGQCWAIGCLYTNTDRETNDEIWWYNHTASDKISGATTTNRIDRYDMESPEVLRFKHRRELWNYIVVCSDMMILQTTQKDIPLYYYMSLQWRNADQNFDYNADAAVGKNLSDIGGTSNNRNWYSVDMMSLLDGTDNSVFGGNTIYKTRKDQPDNMDQRYVKEQIFQTGSSNYPGHPYTQAILGYHESSGRHMQWHRYNEGAILDSASGINSEFGRDWLYRTFTDMWTQNKYSASQLDPLHSISVSGYNGKFNDKDNKLSSFTNTGDENFITFIEQIYSSDDHDWVEDSSKDMLCYNTSGNSYPAENGYRCMVIKMPDIDNCATPIEVINSGSDIREYSSEDRKDPSLDKTGNGVIIKPTDGTERFRGISGNGSPTSEDGISFSPVGYKNGHYVNSNYSGGTYSNGFWNKSLTMDGNAYENKTTAYRSSPFTTANSSSALDGATDSVGSIHYQQRIARPGSPLRLATDRVYPWAVQNGWNGDKQTYSHGIRQDATNENREYLTGNSYVFYRQILDYTRPSLETGSPTLQYDYANKTVSALGGKSGILVDAPYSDQHFKVNNIVVQDPVSVEDTYLVSVDKNDGSALHGEDRDQRVSNADISKNVLERLNASKVCPGTASLCEFRHLDCKYFSDVVLANLVIEKDGLHNTINGKVYKYPTGFKTDSTGNVMTVGEGGARLSIPLGDLGIEFNSALNIQVEFEAQVDYYKTPKRFMFVSFNKYDLYSDNDKLTFNTNEGLEYYTNSYRDGDWHKYKAVFSFNDVYESTLSIDNKDIELKKGTKTPKTLNSSLIGSDFNIGSYGSSNDYAPTNVNYRGVIKITKLGSSGKHNNSCYKIITEHNEKVQYLAIPQKFNYTGSVQYYNVPETGYYRLEAFGASGGDAYTDVDLLHGSKGGLGGYSSGVAYLTKGQKLAIYVGGQGKKATGYFNGGGWNGGGNGGTSGYGGGGASDIRAERNFTSENGLKETTDTGFQRSGKLIYGPYVTIPAGTYKVDIYGDGLNDESITFDVISGYGNTTYGSYRVSNGATDRLTGVSLSKTHSSYTVNITKNVTDAEFRTHFTGDTFRIDRLTVTCTSGTYSLQNRLIVAGGGGGADDSPSSYGVPNDGSGGYGGGLTGGEPTIDGAKQSGYAGTQTGGAALGNGGSVTTQTDTGGGGGGYFGGKPTNHYNGGAGGGSSYVSGLRNSYTTYGVKKGDGEVIITSLDAENAPDSQKKVIRSTNNTHVHNSECVIGANKTDYMKNSTLIGAFYQDAYGDSTALRALLGTTLYNKYKSSDYNQSSKTVTLTYNYTGGRQKLSIPYAGEYQFDVYGASGGGNARGHGSAGGYGARVMGAKYLNPGENVYLYVGGAGGYAGDLTSAWSYGPYMGGGKGAVSGYNGGGMSLVSTSANESIRSGNRLTTTTEYYDELDPSKGTLVGFDDDSGTGLSAYLTVHLNAGQRYLICVGRYRSGSGNCRWDFKGPNGTYLSGTFYVDEGSWSKKTFDTDCIVDFTAPASGTYYMHAYVGGLSDPCAYVTTYATTRKSRTVTVVERAVTGTFTPGQAMIVAGGGGGSDDATSEAPGGANDGTGGDGGDGTLGNPTIDGARQSGYYASYVQGAGESAYANTDTGGGGAGWYGGKVTNHNNGGAGGGSCYTGNGITPIASYNGVNSGNGKIIVTYHSSASLQTIYDAIVKTIAPNASLIPATVNGAKNPVFICDDKYNKHVCNSFCKETKVLKCSDPHHQTPMGHYPVTSDICYSPCGYTDPDDPNNPHAHINEDIDADSRKSGSMVNIDYGFTIHFPNTGDFLGNNEFGLRSVTSNKGPSYKNDMDTTKWLREKRVKFGFDVLFHNQDTGKWEEYKANTWISLPILSGKPEFGKDYNEFTPVEWFKNHHFEDYDFYCLASNVDIAASKVEYEAEAVNAEGSSGKSVPYKRTINNRVEHRDVDNTSTGSNQERATSFISKHSASRFEIVDVVGRIGNMFITDTDDLRFANFFKTPLSEGWLIDGVVRQVDQSKQNNVLTWHTNSGNLWKDIRGVTVKDSDGMYNTWMTQDWLEDATYKEKQGKSGIGSTIIDLPLTSSKNNIDQLKADKLKPGYNILYEISTLGSYGDNLQVIPYFYALDTKTDKLYPVDVYQKNDLGEFVPVNFYDAVPKQGDSDDVVAKKKALLEKEKEYPYLLNLDWEQEAERRNYTEKEKAITKFLQETYVNYDEKTGEHKLMYSPDNTTSYYEYGSGKYLLGTLQYMDVKGFARTFIGSTYTQAEKFNTGGTDTTNIGTYGLLNNGAGVHYTNLDNLIFRDRFWSNAQRWHLTLGTPSSSVFVKYYEDGKHYDPNELLTDSSGNPILGKDGNRIHRYEEVQDDQYAILVTADIYAVGKTFTLKYDHELNNGRVSIGGKQYTFGKSYNGREIKGNIIAVYDADSTSNVDIDIVGSH